MEQLCQLLFYVFAGPTLIALLNCAPIAIFVILVIELERSSTVKININTYRHMIPSLKRIVENNPSVDDVSLIGRAAVATGVPVLAISYFLIELKGDNQVIRNHIDKIQELYKYESVEGII